MIEDLQSRLLTYFRDKSHKAMFELSMATPGDLTVLVKEAVGQAATMLSHCAALGALVNGLVPKIIDLRDGCIGMDREPLDPQIRMVFRTMAAIADEALAGIKFACEWPEQE